MISEEPVYNTEINTAGNFISSGRKITRESFSDKEAKKDKEDTEHTSTENDIDYENISEDEILEYFNSSKEKYVKVFNSEIKQEKPTSVMLKFINSKSHLFNDKIFKIVYRIYFAYDNLLPEDKVKLYASIGYLLSPIDCISDMIPVLGFTDDAFILHSFMKNSIEAFYNDRVDALVEEAFINDGRVNKSNLKDKTKNSNNSVGNMNLF